MGVTDNEIMLRLRNQYQVQLSKKTLQRRLNGWGLKRKTQTQNTEELKARTAELFIKEEFTDAEMMSALKTKPFKITPFKFLHPEAVKMEYLKRNITFSHTINKGGNSFLLY